MATLAEEMVQIAGRTLRDRNVLDAEKMADELIQADEAEEGEEAVQKK